MFLRSVWKSRHGNCVNPSEGNELKVLGLLNAISHCVEFDKLNAMEIALNFGEFSRVFLLAVIFTGYYVKKVY